MASSGPLRKRAARAKGDSDAVERAAVVVELVGGWDVAAPTMVAPESTEAVAGEAAAAGEDEAAAQRAPVVAELVGPRWDVPAPTMVAPESTEAVAGEAAAAGVDEAAAAGEGEGEVAGDDDTHFSKLSKLSSGAIVLVGLSYGTQLVA